MRALGKRKQQVYRRRLENLRWIITREYWKEREGSRDHTKEIPEDEIDLAVRTYTRDFLLSLSEMERHQLFRIEEALLRMDRGSYAVCATCNERIPDARLEAVPWAGMCVVCQGAHEEEVRALASLEGEQAA